MKKSQNMPSLAQQNGFGSTFLHTMFEAHKSQSKSLTHLPEKS